MSTARPELSRQRLAAEHLHKAEAALHVASLLLLDDTERTPEQRALFADVRRAVTFAGTRMAEERAKLLRDDSGIEPMSCDESIIDEYEAEAEGRAP